MFEQKPDRTGRVTLVGGGPGAADLMTVRAMRALAAADVVFYDRLAPTEELREWAPEAELFDVGKRPGHHRVTQENIHSMMLDAAQAGKHVVRLKGGDPFVFGRGCEEVAACRDAGVPVTVVPGITSAISVPAAAGIPVTARSITRTFTVISGHDPLTDEELTGLVALGGTAVILMGVGTLANTLTGLQSHGMRADTPVAVVERGFSDDQRILIADSQEMIATAANAKLRPPAVLVIGEVVRLAAQEEDQGVAVRGAGALGELRAMAAHS
ncbi:uroporphyrinogen-III C-methyltransferase [Nesterenkonia populi]|uniref:uroporphyrinogen-III C-methyltransferase n=1 Tax=Nesterenkonia populi TaxID=1591087 RepID=UPI0011BEBBC9|nr:uroporphyrinogen-III C-methyltransferase [Nesterenkonia populi]